MHEDQLPPVFTEIEDAEVYEERELARKFVFGESENCWVPKSASKIVDGKLYATRWMALQKAKEWRGIFVKGTQYTRMRAMTHQENTVADAIPLMHQVLRDVERILKILNTASPSEQSAALDAAAAKIMQVINKNKPVS